MTDRYLFVSPVGTSILTHGLDHEDRRRLARAANLREHELDDDTKRFIDEHAEVVDQRLNASDAQGLRRHSAELNGLLSYGDTLLLRSSPPEVFHVLLATDTYQGRHAAEAISLQLARFGMNSQVRVFQGLATRDLDEFRSATSDLARWCDEELTGWRDSGWRVVFNLTGGFKLVQGVLQTLAQFYADESIYVFETGTSVLSIPRLPVRFTPDETVRQHAHLIRRMALGQQLDAYACSDVPDALLMRLEGEAALSAWGELVWKRCRDELYRERLLDPPTSAIRCGEDFLEAAEDLPPDRLFELNKRIDDLSSYLAGGRKAMPKSLSYKKLAGGPVDGSTHEFYAWSDRDARRCFCHEKAGAVVIDRLGAHL